MILSNTELKELTNRSQHAAQARELRHMGIEHKIRRDGSIAVSREHVDQVLSGSEYVKIKTVEPNWGAAK
jgi:hypothetical protein